MLNRESIGKAAYGAYCENTNWKSLATGQDLPLWDKLPERIREAWRAVADHLSCFDYERSYDREGR